VLLLCSALTAQTNLPPNPSISAEQTNQNLEVLTDTLGVYNSSHVALKYPVLLSRLPELNLERCNEFEKAGELLIAVEAFRVQ
jgi:hypothetical protein